MDGKSANLSNSSNASANSGNLCDREGRFEKTEGREKKESFSAVLEDSVRLCCALLLFVKVELFLGSELSED